MSSACLRVFLTVDTEVWPFVRGWPVIRLPEDKRDFSAEMRGYIHGDTPAGGFGIPYQLEVLRRHGLKATYFVEPLFSQRAGAGYLVEIVDLVQGAGQEVQLHLHTEWIGELSNPRLPWSFRQHIREFDLDEQTAIVAEGCSMLTRAGVRDICAFRAGNYGAGLETLQALARNRIRFDTSHNACYLDSTCAIRSPVPLYQPAQIEGVVELPVTCFADYPSHLRHAQLCACSFQELRAAMENALQQGWQTFVIVLHSFELVRRVREPEQRTPDPVVLQRFDRLCRFLDENRDRYVTAHFRDLDAAATPGPQPPGPLRSRLHHTAWRYVEQMASRMAGGFR